MQVAVTTREIISVLSERMVFCCCSIYAVGDTFSGLKPIHIPKLVPARIAANKMFANRMDEIISRDVSYNKSLMFFLLEMQIEH